jgi:hypothetical protein
MLIPLFHVVFRTVKNKQLKMLLSARGLAPGIL